nr:immunoglobulin heavy chain junction region [Mus musculus]
YCALYYGYEAWFAY